MIVLMRFKAFNCTFWTNRNEGSIAAPNHSSKACLFAEVSNHQPHR
jgi:hypothetical protein